MFIKQTTRETKYYMFSNSPLGNVASFSIISLSYGKEDGILGGPLRAINSLSAEDNYLQ